MKIGEQVYIPLHWFLISMSSIVASVSVGSFWVKSVNDRLYRIEEKLGIPPLAASHSSMEAHAGERE